jgi:hypothetical protein
MRFAVLCRFAVAALLSVSALPASAQNKDAANAAQLKAYTLTMPKVTAYYAAMVAAEKAAATDPALKAETAAMEKDQNNEDTLAQMKAKFVKHPKVMAYFTSRGLTADDVVTMPFVLLGAAVAAEYGLSDDLKNQVSPEQVAFIKANKAALDKMQPLQQ